MIVYNQYKDWFQIALDSAYKQTYENTEIIVSTVKGDLANEWAKIFPDIKVVDNHSPDAKEQINNALKFAEGEYVIVLGSDDFYYPNAVKSMMNTVLEKDSVLVYSDLHHADENLNIVFLQRAPEFDYQKLKQLQIMCDSSLVKKSVLWEFGFYKPEWKKFAMWEMWLQIGLKYPDKIHHSGTVLCKYRRHNDALSLRAFRGEDEVTGENLRQKFYAQFNIDPDIKNEFVGNEIVTTYNEAQKIILDKI
jgi:glycosyltransferase involved in cell wall biosynthesis